MRVALLSSLPLLLAAGRVEGIVIGYPDGGPLEGVDVLALDPQGAAARGETGPDGTFAIDVRPGPVRLRARAPDDMDRIGAYWGDVRGFCEAGTARIEDGETVDGFVIELPRGGVIEGAVLDFAGQPFPGLPVRARGAESWNRGIVRGATTDAAGRFVIVGLDGLVADGVPQPAAWLLSTLPGDRPGFFFGDTWDEGGALPIEVARGASVDVTLREPPPARVSGRTLRAGVPTPGVVVTLLAAPSYGMGDAVTGADGRFVFEHARGGAFAVRLRGGTAATVVRPGGPSLAAAAFQAGEGSIDLGDLDLPDGGSLAFLLSGGADGGTVTVSGDSGPLSTLAAPAAGTMQFHDLPPGPVTLRWDFGRLPAERSGTVTAGQIAMVDLRAPLFRAVDVTVRGRGRDPLSQASVTASDANGDAVPAVLQATEDNGAYTLIVPPGPLRFGAAVTPFCHTDPGWVTTYSGAARTLSAALPTEASALDFALPPDRDRDAMDDVWELLWDLDITVSDGHLDPDDDRIANVDEYRAESDPRSYLDGAACAAAPGAPGALGLLLACILSIRRSGTVRRLSAALAAPE